MLLKTVLLCLALGSSVLASPIVQVPIQPQDHSQNYKFDPLNHLPGISPYFDAIGFGLDHAPPPGCKVTTASYLMRHGAIYANDEEYDAYIKQFLFKLEKYRGGFSGHLAFLNEWYSPILEGHIEELTPSGADDARKIGAHLAKRYPDLVGTTERVLTDKKNRTYATAQNMIKSFPNTDDIELVVVHKPKDGSIDPIIPHKTCKAFDKGQGEEQMRKVQHMYATRTSARLRPYTPWKLTDIDVIAMQSVCGYESAITGEQSLLCNIFTDVEWMSYEYAWDLKYAHMVGPLNKLSPYLGYPWLKGQTELFQKISHNESTTIPQSDKENNTLGPGWPDKQRLFFSFTHREVPPFIATALGIFNSSFEAFDEFPTDRVVWTRAWKMADLIPFLGHVGLEKMTCDLSAGTPGEYVRIIANTAARPIPHCQSGPGASCPLDEFVENINSGAKQYADYRSACGNDSE